MSAEDLTPLQRAVLALKEMRARLDAAERSHNEPVAVIGLACRFPAGADDPDSLWDLLVSGRDVVSEVPAERWDNAAVFSPDREAEGKTYCKYGAFIQDADRFDARFFGLSPREAAAMDPQHRLLLETAWEALERAGIDPESLTESVTGVYLGLASGDYGRMAMERGAVDSFYLTGTPANAAAGRVSFTLGLNGPSMVFDTACSSSAVAIHQACQALRDGDCALALAGGVNLMLSPTGHIVLSRAGMIAEDGRCKTFSAEADGYGRGEGCGLAVLKRLSDAEADGDRVLAVIRGSAVMHDGASSGFTVPNGQSQRAVIRQALARAGLKSEDVGYVELHGTGTPLGDPIEVRALGAVLCEGRAADRPLLMGAVKSNIGHLEAAAGIASLIKVVLALNHGVIPPNLHAGTRNPDIPWDELPVRVADAPVAWPPGPRVAGINSFGASGTNVHLVVAEAPARPAREPAAAAPRVLTLCARSEAAARALALRLAGHLERHPELDLADVAHTLARGRARMAWRVSVTASSIAEAAAKVRDAVPVKDVPISASDPVAGRTVDLPTYPFERERHWLEAPKPAAVAAAPLLPAAANIELAGVFRRQIDGVAQAVGRVVEQQLAHLRAGGVTLPVPEPVPLTSTVNEAKPEPAPCLAPEPWRLFTPPRENGERAFIVARGADDLAAVLEKPDAKPKRLFTAVPPVKAPEVAFLLPGLGDQYVGMAKGLYETQPVFRRQLTLCRDVFRGPLGLDLLTLLYPGGYTPPKPRLGAAPEPDAETTRLARPLHAHAAIFAVEYALARLWMERGVQPAALLGYSVGEYVAACLSGVLTLNDAALLLTERARLMEALPGGGMLAVPLGADALTPLLGDGAWLGAVNSPNLCIVSGSREALAALETVLGERGVVFRRLSATHAFHTPLMEPIGGRFLAALRGVTLRPPRIPIVTAVTGTWLTDTQATDSNHWLRHACQAVLFADGLGTLLETPGRVLLEVGPGQSLTSFAYQHPLAPRGGDRPFVAAMRNAGDRQDDEAVLLNAAGRLWLLGAEIDVAKL
jgi:acyl transferase domain-containing protein